MCESKRISFYWGAREALPIVFGYFPLAFAYGVLAVQAGLSKTATIAMSVFVYAGASQFMAVGLIAAGTAPAALVVATFVVNLRHLLMSAAISPRLEKMSRSIIALIAFHLTDESFAVMSMQKPDVRLPFGWVAGLQWSAYLAWVLGSASGAFAGAVVTDPARWGLDFALTAMFVALLVMQIQRRAALSVAVVSAVCYWLAKLVVPGHWAVVVAAVVGATIGTVFGGSDSKPMDERDASAEAV